MKTEDFSLTHVQHRGVRRKGFELVREGCTTHNRSNPGWSHQSLDLDEVSLSYYLQNRTFDIAETIDGE